jgi:hypothetical protein
VGELVCVVSSFWPAPLIEALERGGHKNHVIQVSPELFRTYVVVSRQKEHRL